MGSAVSDSETAGSEIAAVFSSAAALEIAVVSEIGVSEAAGVSVVADLVDVEQSAVGAAAKL